MFLCKLRYTALAAVAAAAVEMLVVVVVLAHWASVSPATPTALPNTSTHQRFQSTPHVPLQAEIQSISSSSSSSGSGDAGDGGGTGSFGFCFS